MDQNLEIFGTAPEKRLTKCPHCGSGLFEALGATICEACDFRLYRPGERDEEKQPGT
jgi:uncharacterized Zn finger protein (UPF0148 family)